MAHAKIEQAGDDQSSTGSRQRQMTLIATQGAAIQQSGGDIVSGTILAPGRRFDHQDNVGAVVLKSGERVEAVPSTYFDSSPHGRTIRLWQRTVPGVDRYSRRLQWWRARKDVSEVLSQPQLADLKEQERLGRRKMPVVLDFTQSGSVAKPRRRRFIWQGLIVAVLIAAIAGAVLTVMGLVSVSLDPTYMTVELVAIIGTGALVIFGITCLAIVQRVTTA